MKNYKLNKLQSYLEQQQRQIKNHKMNYQRIYKLD